MLELVLALVLELVLALVPVLVQVLVLAPDTRGCVVPSMAKSLWIAAHRHSQRSSVRAQRSCWPQAWLRLPSECVSTKACLSLHWRWLASVAAPLMPTTWMHQRYAHPACMYATRIDDLTNMCMSPWLVAYSCRQRPRRHRWVELAVASQQAHRWT